MQVSSITLFFIILVLHYTAMSLFLILFLFRLIFNNFIYSFLIVYSKRPLLIKSILNHMNATQGGANLHPSAKIHPGAKIHLGANTAHEHGFRVFLVYVRCPKILYEASMGRATK